MLCYDCIPGTLEIFTATEALPLCGPLAQLLRAQKSVALARRSRRRPAGAHASNNDNNNNNQQRRCNALLMFRCCGTDGHRTDHLRFPCGRLSRLTQAFDHTLQRQQQQQQQQQQQRRRRQMKYGIYIYR